MTEAASSEFQKPKEKMSDGELGNVVSAICNNEAKAMTLLAIWKGVGVLDRKGLRSQVLNLQGENPGWRIDGSDLFSYCSQSLSQIGLVAKEFLNPDLSTWGYALTDYGREIGVPLAGLMLDFSERHNIFLNKLFGATSSRSPLSTQVGEEEAEFKKRSPITTLKIIYEIVTSPSLPVRDKDILDAVGERHNSVGRALNRLKELGLIQYEGIKANKRYSSYKFSGNFPEGELPAYKMQKTLTHLIFNVLQASPNQYLTSEDIYNALPEDIKDNWDKESLFSDISSISFYLTKNNYAEVEKFHQGLQSEVSISEGQRVILTELLKITDGVQNKDKKILEKGRRFAEEIAADPQRAAKLMERAKEASPYFNKRSRDETEKDILSSLYLHPEGLTNREILALLKSDRVIGIMYVGQVTHSLGQKGLVRVSKQGNVKRYFPADKLEEKAV